MIRINLLPRVPRRRLPGRQFMEAALPLVALAAVLVLWAVISGQNAGLRRDIASADEDIATLRPAVARVLELDRLIIASREKEKLVADLLKQQLPAASVLNEVRLLIPREVWVVSMSVPEPSSLGLEGLAMNYYAVARLMDNLTTGQLFREVDLSVVQLEKVGATEVVRFQVTARIVKPQAMGGDRP